MTLIPNLTFTEFWVVSMEHLPRVWHTSRERLPFRTPGSVPLFGTCLCSNCWDLIPQTCLVFTRLFTFNTPWYFLVFCFVPILFLNTSNKFPYDRRLWRAWQQILAFIRCCPHSASSYQREWVLIVTDIIIPQLTFRYIKVNCSNLRNPSTWRTPSVC